MHLLTRGQIHKLLGPPTGEAKHYTPRISFPVLCPYWEARCARIDATPDGLFGCLVYRHPLTGPIANPGFVRLATTADLDFFLGLAQWPLVDERETQDSAEQTRTPCDS